MKKRFVFFSFFIGLVVCTIVLAQQPKGPGFSDQVAEGQWYDQSVALVVGISHYGNGWSSLTEPCNDARRVAEALKAQGFEVIMLTDKQATKDAIMAQIQTYVPAKVGKNGRFVFYYSGHGQTQVAARTGKQLGYLVPADGRKLGGVDDWASYISMDALRGQINNVIPAKHALIVFDSCFSGTALTKSGSMTGNVGYFLGQPAINVLTAGDAGQPTPDGAFSYDFVNAINGSADGVGGQQDGYVTFAEVGAYLQAQIPSKVVGLSPSFGWWDGTSQVVFRYGGGATPPPSPTAVTAQPDYQEPDFSAYDTIAQAEQQRIDAERSRERANRDARQRAIRKAYSKVKGYKDSSSYSAAAKKGVYKQFLEDFPGDNPYYYEVNGWLSEPEYEEQAGMVYIEGGAFWMGCSSGDSECAGEENPRHQVTVGSFWMDAYEVTQAQYQSVMGENPSAFSGCPDCPVEKVTWFNARDYCAKVGKRLPTEAEWEYAARGGSQSARYGNLDSVAWYTNNSGSKTHPVGQKQANTWGLYDMLGNVWEWTADWYGEKYYASSPSNNPQGPSSGSYRVLRGGSWGGTPWDGRASNRVSFTPGGRYDYFGFRCSRDAN